MRIVYLEMTPSTYFFCVTGLTQLLHAVSWAYFFNAALNGMFFHGLLLSTGNILVPIVAHAVHNTFALVHCHLKVRFLSGVFLGHKRVSFFAEILWLLR